jgi:hypothetical protein
VCVACGSQHDICCPGTTGAQQCPSDSSQSCGTDGRCP